MIIYYGLIAYVLLIPLLARFFYSDYDKRKKTTLFLSIMGIFLLFSLRATSVGRDISGYEDIYNQMQYVTWNNFDVSWMEWGYELIMMVFVHIFHASFQTFMIYVYAFIFSSYYFLIKRHSSDPSFSILVYICFIFLTFDMSAVRNAIALAICLYAVPVAYKKGLRSMLLFFATCIIASQVHVSAYIFILFYFIIRIEGTKISAILYAGFPVILLLFRTQLYVLINTHLRSVSESNITIGGIGSFYIAILMFAYIIILLGRKQNGFNYKSHEMVDNGSEYSSIFSSDVSTYFHLVYVGVVIMLFASGTVLTRMAHYFQIFIIILIPNCTAKLDEKSRILIKMLFFAFLIWFFWKYTLIANPLDTVPYRFFWQ